MKELSPHAPREVSYQTMLRLQDHKWRGNVRELKNFIARAIALSQPSNLHLETRYLLPSHLQEVDQVDQVNQDEVGAQKIGRGQERGLEEEQDQGEQGEHRDSFTIEVNTRLAFKDAKSRLIEEFELLYWTRLLRETNDNVSAAARAAGIHRKSAEYLLKKLGLR